MAGKVIDLFNRDEDGKPSSMITNHKKGFAKYFWPDTRCIISNDRTGIPSFNDKFKNCSRFMGIITDLGEEGTAFIIDKLVNLPSESIWKLLLAVNPAGSTKQGVLLSLYEMQEKMDGHFQVRLLLPCVIRNSRLSLNILLWQEEDGQYWLNIGSSSSLGKDSLIGGSANLMFLPDPIILDECAKFFDLYWELGRPLTKLTCEIPFLVPAKGTQEAYEIWKSYEDLFMQCADTDAELKDIESIEVDEETGDIVTEKNGSIKVSEEMEIPRCDRIELLLSELFRNGQAATIDYKAPPLQAPLSPKLFGIDSTQQVGSVVKKVQYTVSLFDEETQKEMEGYRKGVREVLNLFSYGIADGLRWVPNKSKKLMENQIDNLVARSTKKLKDVLQGDINAFLSKRENEIKKGCEKFYKELFPDKELPIQSFNKVMNTLKLRAETALQGKYIPKLTMTSVMFSPNVRSKNQDPWAHALSLIEDIVTVPRKTISDHYFRRRLKDIEPVDFLNAMNVLDDYIVEFYKKDPLKAEKIARDELRFINEIIESDEVAKEKCIKYIDIIKGKREMKEIKQISLFDDDIGR